MNLKYLFFSLHFIFIIIHFHLPTIKCTGNARNTLFQKGLFEKNAIIPSLEGIKITKVAKHLGVIFDKLIEINLHHQNQTVKKNIFTLFDYIYEGFELLSNISKPTVGYPIEISSDSFFDDRINKFLEILKFINNIFDYTFVNYLGDFDGYSQQTVDYFLNTTIYNVTFKSDLEFLQENILETQNHNINIFKVYFRELNDHVSPQKSCGSGPISRKLFNLYKQTLTGIIKGYTLLIIGYEFARLKIASDELKNTQYDYLTLYLKSINSVSVTAYQMLSLLKVEHRSFVNCDPKWKEGENYIRVKNYVSNTLSIVKSYDKEFKSKNEIFQEFECNDYLVHSNFYSSSVYSMKCPDVFNTNSKLYKECSNSTKSKEFVGAYHSHWSAKCSILSDELPLSSTCFCDKQSDSQLSIRKLSLRELYTNTTENKIMTGIRSAVKNNIIRIEIQEGQMKNGVIDPETRVWNPNDGYPPKKGLETVTLDYDVKSFNLDDIKLPFGEFVTGVKFELLENNHISLVVRGTAMYNYYIHGPSTNHQWHYPKTENYERDNIPLEDFHNSADLSEQNEELSRSGRNYVDLAVGIYSHKYKNTPVLPFFDSQDLTSDAPLGGLGFYYKGCPSYGGFLAFKLTDAQFNFNMVDDNDA